MTGTPARAASARRITANSLSASGREAGEERLQEDRSDEAQEEDEQGGRHGDDQRPGLRPGAGGERQVRKARSSPKRRVSAEPFQAMARPAAKRLGRKRPRVFVQVAGPERDRQAQGSRQGENEKREHEAAQPTRASRRCSRTVHLRAR